MKKQTIKEIKIAERLNELWSAGIPAIKFQEMIPELLGTRIRINTGGIGKICGYGAGRVIIGFGVRSKHGWGASSIEPDDIVLKEYPNYWYVRDYEVITTLLKRGIIK